MKGREDHKELGRGSLSLPRMDFSAKSLTAHCIFDSLADGFLSGSVL